MRKKANITRNHISGIEFPLLQLLKSVCNIGVIHSRPPFIISADILSLPTDLVLFIFRAALAISSRVISPTTLSIYCMRSWMAFAYWCDIDSPCLLARSPWRFMYSHSLVSFSLKSFGAQSISHVSGIRVKCFWIYLLIVSRLSSVSLFALPSLPRRPMFQCISAVGFSPFRLFPPVLLLRRLFRHP